MPTCDKLIILNITEAFHGMLPKYYELEESGMSNEGMFAVIENKTERNKCQRGVIDENHDCSQKLGSSKLKIFNSILTDTLEIKEEYKENALNNWTVTFFNDSVFEQTIALKVVDENYFTKAYSSNCYKENEDLQVASVALYDNFSNSECKNNIIKRASKFVCNNVALNEASFTNAPSELRYVDGKGMIILKKYQSTNKNLDQPKREVLLLMLAIAYHQAFQEIGEGLASALEKSVEFDEIEELYENAAQFNARYYFFNPVKIKNYHTFVCWEHIRESYQLEKQYREVNEQIKQVHSILSHRRKQREEKENFERQQENETWYKNITILGVILSLFGLLDVADKLNRIFKNEIGYWVTAPIAIAILFWIYAKPMLNKLKSSQIQR